MHKRLAVAVVLSLLVSVTSAAQTESVDKIFRDVPLIDGHNDLPWQLRERVGSHLSQLDLRKDQSKLAEPLHTDLERLRRGRIGAQFWSVYVPASMKGPEAVQATLEQIDIVHRLAESYPEALELARTADDIVRIHRSGRIASLIGVEGGHSINNSLAILRELYGAGARYMTLTHSDTTEWADSATDAPKHGGLAPFGKVVIGEMNRLGMVVDLSHVSPESMHDALDATAAPVIFSHSSARALTDHPRNVPDDVLRRLAANGGVVMVTWVPSFVSEPLRRWQGEVAATDGRLKELYPGQPGRVKEESEKWLAAHPRPAVTLGDVADHVEYVMRVAGEDHVGIGADLDGIDSTPIGLESVADYPKLFAELARRGHTPAQLEKLAGRNLLRVLRQVEAVAARIRKERPASDVRIGEAGAQ